MIQRFTGNHYHLTALPGLEELGSPPPLQPGELLEHVADRPGPRALIETLFLFDDLLQREAFLSGELKEVAPAVLTPAQMRNEEPLPAYLSLSADDMDRLPDALTIDSLWDRCFRYAGEIAQQHGSLFLAGWIGREVALRNALAAARAGRLGLEASDYLVARDLAGMDEDFSSLLSEWSAAPTPLAGLQVLIKARWAWLAEHDAWFSFGDDELAAYAAKLMLLHQWRRLVETGRGNQAADNTNASTGIIERTI